MQTGGIAMRLIKIGLANIDTTVGAHTANTDKVIEFARQMSESRCTIGAFQEQVISGYPAEDLVQWDGFVQYQWYQLNRFIEETKKFEFSTIFILGLTAKEGGSLYNSAAVVYHGQILGVVPKEELPTYGVFYERRTFSRGIPGRVSQVNGVPFGDLIFEFPFGTIAAEVCEDIWSADGPMRRRAYSGVELVVNISASPYRAGILNTRREMISTRAADNQATVAYINQFGGQDSLVFDGGGFVNQNGRMLLEVERWREGWTDTIADLDRTTTLREANTTWRMGREDFLRENKSVRRIVSRQGPPVHYEPRPYPAPASRNFFLPPVETPPSPQEELFEDLLAAMQTGLAGSFEKTDSFERIGIALSGGKDSALTLIIAWLYAQERFADLGAEERKAAIRDFIHCFSMPSQYNTERTRGIARRLCEELGVSFKEVPIQEAFEREVQIVKTMLDGHGPTPLTLENIQARIRAQRMWNWTNTAHAFWLQTGNMSEKAVGYTTIGGDMMGGYSLIGNLPKTVIIALLHYLDRKFGWPCLKDLLTTKASAELAENQEDEKDLMPFPVLDACIHLFAGEKLSPDEVFRAVRTMWTDVELAEMHPGYQPGMLKDWVKKFVVSFFRSIFKWVQAPQSVHLGALELDRERALQLPVVTSTDWLRLDQIDKESN